MNRYFWQIFSLFLFLNMLFPCLGKCQNLTNNQSNSWQLLNNNSQDLPLTLADAVYIALENNRELKIAYLQRILDKKQLAETEAQFNPTITPQLSISSSQAQNGDNQTNNNTYSLGASVNWKIPTGGTMTLTLQGQNQLSDNIVLDNKLETQILNHNISFNFSQPLLKDFGRQLNTINMKKARLTEKANILNWKNTNAQIITNTILSYRNLLLAQERLKIEQISAENARKDLERLQALFEFGRIPKNDLIERQADIAQQEVNLVNTQTALDQAITDLIKLLDISVTKKLIAVETPTVPTTFNLPSYAEMLELALTNNSSYISAVNNVENAKFNIIESKNQQQWDLKFNLGYGFNTASNSQDSGNLTSSFILSREFGNLSQDNAVEKSEISQKSAVLSLENTRKNIEEELKTKMRNVEDTFRQIKLAQQARELAETRLNNAKEKKRLKGNMSMTDIINFEKGLVDTKNQELNAMINHLNSITQMEQFLGITVNTWSKK
jgi:outer membrane protein